MRVHHLFELWSNETSDTSHLQTVHGWILKYRTLRSFTLNIVRIAAQFNELIQSFEKRKPRFSKTMAFLQLYLRSREKEWQRVQRRLELCIGQWEGPSQYDPYQALEELCWWLEWDLWINGQLCYKDGKWILRPFELNTRGWQTMVGGKEEHIL